MMLKFIALLLLFSFVGSNVVRQDNSGVEVDIICWSVETFHYSHIGVLKTCNVDSNVTIDNIDTKVSKVLYRNGKSVNTPDLINAIYIGSAENMKFLPSGLKNIFNNIKALWIANSGLMHLDVQDMKPFGENLQFVRFYNTALTALDGDLFKYNTNLIYIEIEHNKLKYIDSKLFDGFNRMQSLAIVDFRNCGCINRSFNMNKNSIQTFKWNADRWRG